MSRNDRIRLAETVSGRDWLQLHVLNTRLHHTETKPMSRTDRIRLAETVSGRDWLQLHVLNTRLHHTDYTVCLFHYGLTSEIKTG